MATVRTEINGILFDALIDEQQAYSASVPDYPVEDGFSVSDTMTIEPTQLKMTLMISDTPVTYNEGNGLGRRSIEKASELEEMWMKRELLTIVTSTKTYKDYVITSYSVSHGSDTGYAREITITARQVIITSTRTAEVSPQAAPKAAPTKSNGGKASTSKVEDKKKKSVYRSKVHIRAKNRLDVDKSLEAGFLSGAR